MSKPRSTVRPPMAALRAQLRHVYWIGGKTSDPKLAQRNLLERDRMFTNCLFEETEYPKFTVIEIDTAMNEGQPARRVTQVFGP